MCHSHFYAAASNIFSIKMPYPVVGSFTSTWVTAPMSFPVAVPEKIFGLMLFLDFFDRCHSLGSLAPPPAAVASLPVLDNGTAGHACVNIGTKKLCIPRGIHSFGSCKYVLKNHKDGRDCQTGANMGNQSHTGGYTGIPS